MLLVISIDEVVSLIYFTVLLGNQLSLTLLPLSLTTITVVTATLLSNTRWHSVAIDARGGEIRIRVDWETFIVRADRGHRLVSGDTELFVGGDPRYYI